MNHAANIIRIVFYAGRGDMVASLCVIGALSLCLVIAWSLPANPVLADTEDSVPANSAEARDRLFHKAPAAPDRRRPIRQQATGASANPGHVGEAPQSLQERQFRFLVQRNGIQHALRDDTEGVLASRMAERFDLPAEAQSEEALWAGATKHVADEWASLWEKRLETTRLDHWPAMLSMWRSLSLQEGRLLHEAETLGLDLKVIRPVYQGWSHVGEPLQEAPPSQYEGYQRLVAALLHPGSGDHASDIAAYASVLDRKYRRALRPDARAAHSQNFWQWLTWTPDQRMTDALLDLVRESDHEEITTAVLGQLLDDAGSDAPGSLEPAQVRLLVTTVKPKAVRRVLLDQQDTIAKRFPELVDLLLNDQQLDSSVTNALLVDFAYSPQVIEAVFDADAYSPDLTRQRRILLQTYILNERYPRELSLYAWANNAAASVEVRVAAVEAIVSQSIRGSTLPDSDGLAQAIPPIRLLANNEGSPEVREAAREGLATLTRQRDELTKEKQRIIAESRRVLADHPALQKDRTKWSPTEELQAVTISSMRFATFAEVFGLLGEQVRRYLEKHDGKWPQQLTDLEHHEQLALPAGSIRLFPVHGVKLVDPRVIVAIGDEPILLQGADRDSYAVALLLANLQVALIPIEGLDEAISENNELRSNVGLPTVDATELGGLSKHLNDSESPKDADGIIRRRDFRGR